MEAQDKFLSCKSILIFWNNTDFSWGSSANIVSKKWRRALSNLWSVLAGLNLMMHPWGIPWWYGLVWSRTNYTARVLANKIAVSHLNKTDAEGFKFFPVPLLMTPPFPGGSPRICKQPMHFYRICTWPIRTQTQNSSCFLLLSKPLHIKKTFSKVLFFLSFHDFHSCLFYIFNQVGMQCISF